jgi:hypothetical protein
MLGEHRANACRRTQPVGATLPSERVAPVSERWRFQPFGQVPLLLAVSDDGPQMRSESTCEFMAALAIAQQFGRRRPIRPGSRPRSGQACPVEFTFDRRRPDPCRRGPCFSVRHWRQPGVGVCTFTLTELCERLVAAGMLGAADAGLIGEMTLDPRGAISGGGGRALGHVIVFSYFSC